MGSSTFTILYLYSLYSYLFPKSMCLSSHHILLVNCNLKFLHYSRNATSNYSCVKVATQRPKLNASAHIFAYIIYNSLHGELNFHPNGLTEYNGVAAVFQAATYHSSSLACSTSTRTTVSTSARKSFLIRQPQQSTHSSIIFSSPWTIRSRESCYCCEKRKEALYSASGQGECV